MLTLWGEGRSGTAQEEVASGMGFEPRMGLPRRTSGKGCRQQRKTFKAEDSWGPGVGGQLGHCRDLSAVRLQV